MRGFKEVRARTMSGILLDLSRRAAGSRRANRDPLTRAVASCGVAEPSIAYIGAASGDDTSFFKMISGLMRVCGAGEGLAPLAGRRVKLDTTRSILEKADMIFISGR